MKAALQQVQYMRALQRVLHNSAWGAASEVVGGAMLFLAFVLIARYLGTVQFGIFSLVLACIGLAQVVADSGISNILVRDMARDKSNAANMLAAAVFLVAGFSLAIFIIVGLLIYGWGASSEVLRACLIMGAAAVITFQASVFAAACRAHEEMKFNAAGNVTYRLFILILVGGAIHLKAGLLGIALAYLLAGIYQYLFFYLVVRIRYFPLSWRLSPSLLKYLLRQSYQIGAAMIFRRANRHVVTLLLAAFSTPHAVGLFNAALKIIQLFEMIPATLSMPSLPAFSRLAMDSSERLFQALSDAMRIFTTIGLPLFTWVLLLAPVIIGSTFGPAYGGAAATLQVVSLVMLSIFPASLYIYAFTALNQQRSYTISTAVGLGVIVVLGLALIPAFSELGAAAAIVAGELAFFVSGFALLRRRGYAASVLTLFGKPLLASAVASPILLVATQTTSVSMLIAYTFAYGLAYVLLIVALKGMSRKELAFLKSVFQPRLRA